MAAGEDGAETAGIGRETENAADLLTVMTPEMAVGTVAGRRVHASATLFGVIALASAFRRAALIVNGGSVTGGSAKPKQRRTRKAIHELTRTARRKLVWVSVISRIVLVLFAYKTLRPFLTLR